MIALIWVFKELRSLGSGAGLPVRNAEERRRLSRARPAQQGLSPRQGTAPGACLADPNALNRLPKGPFLPGSRLSAH